MVNRQKSPKLVSSKILKRQDITDDLLIMWIEKPDGFSFKAGQYCTIGSGGIERAYSIVSAPYEDSLELFVELVPPPDGALTPLLWNLYPGDFVTIRPRAKGVFVFKPTAKHHFLISTVTGVVPYVSFIRDYLQKDVRNHKFYILQGASYRDEFTYFDELSKISRQHPTLSKYIPTISRPSESQNSGWKGETGRVNQIVEKYIEEFGLSVEDTLVYACGHPGMIEDVKDQLLPKGFNLEEERFWKDD